MKLRSRLAAMGSAAVLAASAATLGAQAAPRQEALHYVNPVSASFADTYADPSVIQAKDGYWYAYATADPLRAGDAPGIMHIARTKDWVTWDYLGTVFTNANRPRWATPTSGLWAPDIRYIGGKYVLYFTVTDTTLNPGDDSAIGVATSDSPQGPFTPTSAPVVAPRADGTDDNGATRYLWTFDPAGFTDVDGTRYLYYGSYYGGISVTRVTADGLRAVGTPRQVAHGDRYEGAYVVRHGSYYYLMGSAANCCAGPTTGYSVFAGRSRSPLGPFVDADGRTLLESRVGGTTVLTQNGNRWIGAGHNAVFTDTAGRDWIVYHAIDRSDPWLTQPFGINKRPMLIDRLDWINGWPRTRAGRGPSETSHSAPRTTSQLSANPRNLAAGGFAGLRPATDPQGGRVARLSGTARSTSSVTADSVRVRLDVRTSKRTTVHLGRGANTVQATYNPRRRQLSVTTDSGKQTRTVRDSVRRVTGWVSLSLEVTRRTARAQLSESDLNDPLAAVSLARRATGIAGAPVVLRSANALVDNLTVHRLARDARRLAPVPRPTSLLWRDEFSSGLSSRWTWVREDPDITVRLGRLVWPLKSVDLVGTGNTGALLLADAPTGDYIVETKVHLDLGVDEPRNYQQAGLVIHASDDDFARLGTVAIWGTRQVEYGRERAGASDGRLSYGGAVLESPAPTIWMRIAHHRNAAGEHVYRAAISRDGVSWRWGAAWTFAKSTTPRLGLYAGGGEDPPVRASFDYVRVSNASWPTRG